MTEKRRFENSDELALNAAHFLVEQARQAISERGRFLVVLSGGSTPKAMHHILADKLKDQVEWSKVFVFWGDERSVPPDDDDSNFKMAKDTLLDYVPIPESQIFRIQAELSPQDAAADYEQQLKVLFAGAERPVFDLIFLGMGPDGHTASLFPHTEALKEEDHWVAPNYVEKMNTWRITLTAPVINAGRHVVFLVAGASKADVLREVINGPYLPETYPSQLIAPEPGNLTWFLDEAAAALI